MFSSRRFSFLLGILIIFAGVVWLLGNLGVIEIGIRGLIRTYWPLLLVLWGLDRLIPRSKPAGESRITTQINMVDRIAVFLVILLGLLILGNNLELFRLDLSVLWTIFWPLVFIFLGWSLLRGSLGTGGISWAVMSGIDYREEGWKLENRSFFALMGGIDLDLTRAEIPEGETVLDLTAIMGGITLKVPREMQIECQGTALFGGVDFFEDSSGGIFSSRHFVREGDGGSEHRLYIRGRTFMGGLEITGNKQ